MSEERRETRVALYGLLAEFTEEEALLAGARRAYEAGYREMDAYSPFPVEGLAQALGDRPSNRLNYLGLAGLAVGAVLGFGLQYYTSVIAYPLNVGGRPLNSWPAFLPLTFEMMFLLAAVVVFGGMLVTTGLPARHRALREARHFDLASRDRFFLVIQSHDRRFDPEETHHFLHSLNPLEVNVIEY